jgi:hypothetical protein
MPTVAPSILFDQLQSEYPDRLRVDPQGICHLRVDESYADAAHSACSVQLTLNSTASDEFCLELINVPWNFALADLVAEVGATLTGDDSRKVLRLSGTARNYRQIKHLAKAVRAVTGRGERYLNSNWKWSTRKTAEALDRLADCLLAAHRQRKSR